MEAEEDSGDANFQRPDLPGREFPDASPVNWRAWAERALLALLVLLFVVRGFIPAWSHLDSDCANYYLAARLYRDGHPVERVYEWTWFQRQKDHAGIERLSSVYTVDFDFSSDDLAVDFVSPLQANRCWLAISLGLLFLAAALLKKMTSLAWRRIGALIFWAK